MRAVVALGLGLTLATDLLGLLLVLPEVLEGGGVVPFEGNNGRFFFLGGVSLTGLEDGGLVPPIGGVGDSLFRFLVLRLFSSF